MYFPYGVDGALHRPVQGKEVLMRHALTLVLFSMLSFACAVGSRGDNSSTSNSADAGSVRTHIDPKEDPNRIASLTITVNDTPTTEIVLPRDQTVTLSVEGRTASNGPTSVDLRKISWEFSNGTLDIQTNANGTKKLTASSDWFDAATAGTEPTATVTARYGELTAKLATTNVINLTGQWTAQLDRGNTRVLLLSQNGRTVTDMSTFLSGEIAGNTLEISNGGFSVSAKFESRIHAIGTYAGTGVSGRLTCDKNL